MALTEDQLQHYYREGYLVLPRLVPGDSIRAVLAAAPPPGDGSGWQARIFQHEDPDQDVSIHRLLVEPGVTEAVSDIFGLPPRVYYGMLAIVPARGGTGLPWHQDNQYNHVLPQALNVFIALSEITPEKAILWVAPGSHRRGVQPSRDSDLYGAGHREAAVEPENGIPLPTLHPGDACIFDRSTYHRSLCNETDEHRYAYAAQYAADNARRTRTGERDPRWMRASDLRDRWRGRGLLA